MLCTSICTLPPVESAMPHLSQWVCSLPPQPPVPQRQTTSSTEWKSLSTSPDKRRRFISACLCKSRACKNPERGEHFNPVQSLGRPLSPGDHFSTSSNRGLLLYTCNDYYTHCSTTYSTSRTYILLLPFFLLLLLQMQ